MTHRLEETADGSFSLAHSVHGECFHSQMGARSEAEGLYMETSGFRAALALGEDLTVLDVGLGLGYNALAAVAAWCQIAEPGHLCIDSLEHDDALVDELATGAARWMTGWPDSWGALAAELEKTDFGWILNLTHLRNQARCEWRIYVADAQTTLQSTLTKRSYQYVWQDPFSPKHNPALWSSDWFSAVRQVSVDASKLVTYSVAKNVRDALDAAGWTWKKVDAAGDRKRHWLTAHPTNPIV